MSSRKGFFSDADKINYLESVATSDIAVTILATAKVRNGKLNEVEKAALNKIFKKVRAALKPIKKKKKPE